MRRYYRLFLLIITLLSVLLLLVYRHQYNRLHYVLEVFDFFGQPCNVSNLENSEDVLSQHDWGPVPVWKESEKIYFYSAFWTNQNEVKAIALAPIDTNHPRSCFLWYEDKRKPISGKFRFSLISQSVEKVFKTFFYYCESRSESSIVPYAVSFTVKNKLVESKKILLTNNLNYQVNLNVTICVLPSAFNKTKFVEFLGFHRMLGINSFVFYGGSVPHRISKLISNLSKRLDIHAAFFPWNFPYNDRILAQEIISFDCILRNRNQSFYATVLEIEEYVVPEQHDSLLEFLDSIDHDAQRVSIPVLKFCLEHANPDKPIALQNIELANTKEMSVLDFYRVNVQNKTISVHKFDKNFAALNKYVHCSEKGVKRIVNASILKYSVDFMRSTLVQMLKNGTL